MKLLLLFSPLIMLSACGDFLTPADMRYGQQLCEQHGGLVSAARFDRGHRLAFACQDETLMEVRLKSPRTTTGSTHE